MLSCSRSSGRSFPGSVNRQRRDHDGHHHHHHPIVVMTATINTIRLHALVAMTAMAIRPLSHALSEARLYKSRITFIALVGKSAIAVKWLAAQGVSCCRALAGSVDRQGLGVTLRLHYS